MTHKNNLFYNLSIRDLGDILGIFSTASHVTLDRWTYLTPHQRNSPSLSTDYY